MIAYNRQDLDNRDIQEEVAEASAKRLITAEEHTRIREAYPCKLYTPNVYIRIGIFLLTILASACCLGLLALMGLWGSDRSAGVLLIVFGMIAYGALEWFIRVRGIYRSGQDDALMWVAAASVLAGIDINAEPVSASAESLVIFVLATLNVLRYTDRLMALVAYGALLGFFFFTLAGEGPVARSLLPFVVMAVSVVFYFLFTRLSAASGLRHYHSCFTLLRVATLLSFYLAGNYYVVREMNASLSGESGSVTPGESGSVALGFLWWALTVCTPVFYIVRGIQKKDVIFLWTGLALVAATVFTIRYYYHVLPAELAMIIGGSLLIAVAYYLIRHLRTPKHGFTSAAAEEPHLLEKLPVEALIQAESFQTTGTRPAGPDTRFGGGSGGGGGAGGQY